ncbi:hypothetical protein KIPB_014668, partial [Kipferlia bialata]
RAIICLQAFDEAKILEEAKTFYVHADATPTQASMPVFSEARMSLYSLHVPRSVTTASEKADEEEEVVEEARMAPFVPFSPE